MACVLVAFAVYAVLGRTVESPRAFTDELLYFDAAGSLAEGDGMTVRGEPYRYAPLYPLVVAPLMRIAPDRAVAYELAKGLNALLFAMAAVPIFLLARRLLRPWSSVAVAALSVALPSGMYVSVVMTESLAYFLSSWALLAISLALERPTVLRQLAALAAIGAAVAARPQFAALYMAYIVGLAVVAFIDRRQRPLAGVPATSLWPTGISILGATTFAVVVQLVPGTSASTLLGGYSALWRVYDLHDIATFVLYELANLGLYVGVIPYVVMPIVLSTLVTRSRSRRHLTYAALFVTANSALLVVVASFDSVDFRFVHDRYLFYLVPLWLIGLLAWLEGGAPRPRLAACVGAVFALELPFFLSVSGETSTNGLQHINAMASTLWTGIDLGLADVRYASAGAALFVFTLVLVTATLVLPTRGARLLPAVVLAVFAVTGDVGWYFADSEARAFAQPVPRTARTWVDDRVGSERSVTLLVTSSRCPGWEWPESSFYLTEFFNRSVKRVAHVGLPPDPLPHTAVRVEPTGRLSVASGAPLHADYVVTQPGVRLEGRRVGEGTLARLVLWEIRGPVRTIGVGSTRELEQAVCRHRQLRDVQRAALTR